MTSSTAQETRQNLKQKYGRLYEGLILLLTMYDLIHLPTKGVSSDECEPVVDKILLQLDKATSELLSSGDRLLRRLKWSGENRISPVFALMYSNGNSSPLAEEQEWPPRLLHSPKCFLNIEDSKLFSFPFINPSFLFAASEKASPSLTSLAH